MSSMLKILATNEKKITLLTVLFKESEKDKDSETSVEKEKRRHLGIDIAALKKTNGEIVNHYLKEHKLSAEEINKITATHVGE